MNTAVTQCPRCTGAAGAHYAFCFIAETWERVMGDRFPWMPPKPEPLPEEPDWDAIDHLLEQEGYHVPGPWDDDPPDYAGVQEDTAVAMGAPSDADWLPNGMWIAPDDSELHCSAVTHLPDGYYDQLTINVVTPQPRVWNLQGLELYRQERSQAQEDAAVQFLYDECDFTPGTRVALSEVYERFVVWQKANDKASMAKDKLRDLLRELGLDVVGGRLPGMREAGRAPLLVHGVTLHSPVQEVPSEEPTVVVHGLTQRKKHPLLGSKPGGELPKQVRDLIEPLIHEQGWEYQPHGGTGKGKPRVKSPAGKVCTLPSSPHLQGHTLENTRSFLKQNGALL